MVVKNGIIAKLPLTTARAATGIVPVQILATLEQDPVGLAVDDKHVYWCATGVDELRRVPKLP